MNETSSQPALYALVLVLFPVAFFVLVFAVNHGLSALGGWKKLAAAYRATEEPPGPSFPWRSCRVGWVNYNNCVNFIAGTTGLHMTPALFLRLGHRSLFLPWSELDVVRTRGWILEYVELRAKRAPAVRLRLSRGLADQLLAAAGRSLPG